MSGFAGQAVLVVNTASFCGFTRQYGALQQVFDTYRARGLVVLGVPSNDFGGQEPGTAAEIKQFCEVNFAIAPDGRLAGTWPSRVEPDAPELIAAIEAVLPR